MKIAILVSKYTPKRINRNMFSIIFHEKYPIAIKRVSKIFILYMVKKYIYIKNGNL